MLEAIAALRERSPPTRRRMIRVRGDNDVKATAAKRELINTDWDEWYVRLHRSGDSRSRTIVPLPSRTLWY
jgi:hypothetical protein